MRFYIVDDDINVVKILKNIIIQKSLGDIVGFSYDGDTAVEDIANVRPDIVLVDYLMPNKDGCSVVKSVKERFSDIHFIAISQVSDKDMISDLYQAGVDFYIQKPLNIIEIENVIASVKKIVEATRAITNIQSMLGQNIDFTAKPTQSPMTSVHQSEAPSSTVSNTHIAEQMKNIKHILSQIGILGEKGSYDIITICEKILTRDKSKPLKINTLYKSMDADVKVIKQRIRRSIYIGLTNVANLGLEDYMNEFFVRYSNSLYDFESVKAEMDYIRKKRPQGGKVNINKFIECLVVISEFE